MLILTELSDDGEPVVHHYRGSTIRIGRVAGNDLVLPVTHISSRHAKIRRQDGRYLVTDLDSTNGSYVERNDERLLLGAKGADEIALEDGDYLVLGDVDNPIRLKVDIDLADSAEGVDSTIVASRNRSDNPEEQLGDNEMLRSLYRLVHGINTASGRQEVLEQITQVALDTIDGAVDALVVRVDQGGLEVLAQAHAGAGITTEPNAKICQQVGETGQALLFGQQSQAVPAQTLVAQGLGSGIAAPLWGHQQKATNQPTNELMGVLQINCDSGRLDLGETHLDLAVILAHHAETALQKADLIERLRAAERQLREENAFLRKRHQPTVQMVAESPLMQKVVAELQRAASTDVTVLLQGETGTGKEVAARFVHEHSRRADKLLVPVNCGALTETLLDSELFGHKKGAFTGATTDRKGVFEMAHGGTVFLDEVGEMPASLQVRLLRVLEENKIRRVGDSVERPVSVRIVAASNRDLAKMVEEGTFRQDLYYRLCVFPVRLPPLRERTDDIKSMVTAFVARFRDQLGKRVGEIEDSFVDALKRYSFPGNVRELVNEVERAMVRADDDSPITADLLSEDLLAANASGVATATGAQPTTLREILAAYEREVIVKSLAQHDGRKIATAKSLGLTRQGLAKKMDRLGIK